MVARRKLAGVDDLYTAIRQPAPAGFWGAGAQTTSSCNGPPPNSRLCLAVVGETRALLANAEYPTVRGPPLGSWLRLAPGGCAKPQAAGPAATMPLISTKTPNGEPITNPARAAHTPAALESRQDPSPLVEGGRAGAFMSWATAGFLSGGVAK